MKYVVIPLISAMLLAGGVAAADASPSGPCAAGERQLGTVQKSVTGSRFRPERGAAPRRVIRPGAVRQAAAGCATRGQILGNSNFLSDKELERALKRQLRGRLIDAKLNPARVEYTVLWEEQKSGKRVLRKLIVDAKTGRVKREIRGGA